MRVRLSLFLSVAALVGGPASAETLRDALAKAYQNNPTLTAQRAAQRANDENVPIARAGGRPTVSVSGGVNENLIRSGNNFTTPERLAQGNASVTLPLYQGGRVRNGVRAAEIRVDAGAANLRGVEASTFTDVVSAYNNVLRDEAIVSLNRQNVRVLETNLRASRDRFEVGDLTRTDVAQSEARLSLARAQLQTVQANLIASRENYVRLVGTAPDALEAPPPLPALPTAPDTAVEVALRDNPTLYAARRVREATDYDVRVARAGRLPQVGVTAGQNYLNYLGSLGAGTGLGVGQTGTSTAIGLSLSLPIFQGGANGGFHEAIGDFVALSITPSYLTEIGLLEDEPDASKDIGLLMAQALDRVAFLPFGLIMDKWRWQVFSGELTPETYNDGWWELRTRYQGIRPPVDRGGRYFDPGAKYHIPANVSYERYYIARILQFQFHKAACEQAGWEGPLHRCSIYGSKEVGEKFNAMMEMGASQPWPDALEAFTGVREIDGEAVLEYFEPLMVWLREQNRDRSCGW